MRLYKRDEADGSLEFIGEDEIGPHAEGRDLQAARRRRFDIVGERKRTDFHVDTSRHVITEA